jgi:hypothetical protein
MMSNPVGEFCPFPRKPGRRERIKLSRERRAAGIPIPAQTPAKERPPDRTITHGTIPDATEGWVADRPTKDAELRIERVSVVRFDDGNVQKFYLMRVKPSVLAEKKALLKKKLKLVKRSIERHERTVAKRHKQEARMWVALLGH